VQGATPKLIETVEVVHSDVRMIFKENPVSFPSPDEGMIELSYPELEALGIYTDGNILRYENITDTVANFNLGKDKPMGQMFFSVKIEEHGSSRTNRGYEPRDSPKIKASRLFWPLFVERISKDTDLIATESIVTGSDELEYFNATKDYLISVAVSLVAKSGKYSHDNTLVFWFKPEQAFYDALPAIVAIRNKDRFTIEKLRGVESVRRGYNMKLVSDANYRIIDSAMLLTIRERSLTLTKKELKNLNIVLTKDGYKYDNRFLKTDKVNTLKIRERGYYTETEINNTLIKKPSVRKTDKDFYPLAISGENMRNMSFFYFLNNEVSEHEKLHKSRELFRGQINELVPVKVEFPYKDGTIRLRLFWFEPTKAFLDALSPESRDQLLKSWK
jgi:hypothetical protein